MCPFGTLFTTCGYHAVNHSPQMWLFRAVNYLLSVLRQESALLTQCMGFALATLLAILLVLPFKGADRARDFRAFIVFANESTMAQVWQTHRGSVLETSGVMHRLGAATVLVPHGVGAADLYGAGVSLVLPSNDVVACGRVRAATL